MNYKKIKQKSQGKPEICTRKAGAFSVDGGAGEWYSNSEYPQPVPEWRSSMEKKKLQSILAIIAFAAGLMLVVLRLDALLDFAGRLLGLLRPVYLGFALAFVLNRPCQAFYRLYDRGLRHLGASRLSRPLAVVSSYLLLIAALGILVSFVVPKVVESGQLFAASLSGYLYNLREMAEKLFTYLHVDADFLNRIQIPELTTYLKSALEGLAQGVSNTVLSVVAFTGTLISALVTGLMSVIFSIYMLSGRETLLPQCRRVLRAYVPAKAADAVLDVVHLTAATFTNFVSGQLIEACILGGLCAAGMLFIQADYAPLIGVIIGASALVPVAGAYVGAVLAAFLLVMVSPVKALIFLVFLAILQQIEGNVIYPRVVGTSIGLPGIWVLTAVTVGGGLFGLPGVLLSVPAASVLYTLLKQDVRRRLARSGS